jgi:hypothetical protein
MGIVHLVQEDSYRSPSFIPLVDEIQSSSLRKSNCNLYHNCPVNQEGEIASKDALKEISEDPRKLLLSSKIYLTSPALNYPDKVTKDFSIVWNEYLAVNKLSPFGLIFVGGPQCGKTETSQQVAKM